MGYRRKQSPDGGRTQTLKLPDLKCISQIFFICSIKSPQCADKCSKKKFREAWSPELTSQSFPVPCF